MALTRRRSRFSAAIVGCLSRPGGCRQAWRICPRHTRFGIRGRLVRSRCLREVRKGMGGRTASVAVARAASARVLRRAGSPFLLARFNPKRAEDRRRTAVDGNPFPTAPTASVTRPARTFPRMARGPGDAPPGQLGLRRATSAAMSKVRHGQQQDAHRRDAPGRDPGRHGSRV